MFSKIDPIDPTVLFWVFVGSALAASALLLVVSLVLELVESLDWLGEKVRTETDLKSLSDKLTQDEKEGKKPWKRLWTIKLLLKGLLKELGFGLLVAVALTFIVDVHLKSHADKEHAERIKELNDTRAKHLQAAENAHKAHVKEINELTREKYFQLLFGVGIDDKVVKETNLVMSQPKFVLENASLFCQFDPLPDGNKPNLATGKLMKFYGTFSATLKNISSEAQLFKPEPEFHNVIDPPEGMDDGYMKVKVLGAPKPVEEDAKSLREKNMVKREGSKRTLEKVQPVEILPGGKAEFKFEWQTFKRYADMEPYFTSTPILGGLKVTVQSRVPEIEFRVDYAHRNKPKETSEGNLLIYELEGVVLAHQGMTLYWLPKEEKKIGK